MEKPSLNQLSHIFDFILSDQDLKKNFDFKNEDIVGKTWLILEDITKDEYRHWLGHLYNRKGYKLMPILTKRGLPLKPEF